MRVRVYGLKNLSLTDRAIIIGASMIFHSFHLFLLTSFAFTFNSPTERDIQEMYESRFGFELRRI